ncbi:hypothetical protein BDV93DRAFT_499963 [Ceratobasidium sp. AG-I]|nr:hypothetical protein BDV93DRAFT_499963 [Ceratobasidium sp. AG-I]
MRVIIPFFLCVFHVVHVTALSAATVGLVKARLKEAAQKSWELGTRSQALLELDSPSVSVFTASSIPGSPAAKGTGVNLTPVNNIIKSALASGELKDVVAISTEIVSTKAAGTLPLMKDGSAADPASNGVAVLVANWTGAQGSDFSEAAKDQLDWLLNHVPRSSKGAISHRNNAVQLWSDFIYMVPPFLAYYGATTSNSTLVAESYRQIKLYRDVLLDDSGLWQHVRQGSFEDKGLWSTGNGWAAMGMMRVAATIKAAGYESQFKDELKDLSTWTAGIFDAMWPLLTEDNLFYNYADNSKTFLDGASSALMAASVYRAAVLFGNTDHLAAAEKVYTTIGGEDPTSSSSSVTSSATSSSTSTETPEPGRKRHAAAARRPQHHRVALSPLHHSHSSRATKHLTSTGWLTPVVDPHAFHKVGKESAEGQAFVLMMYAARNDWIASGGVVGNGTAVKGKTNGAAANIVGVGVVAGSPASVGDGSSGGLSGVGNVGPSVSNSTSSNSTTSAGANGAQRTSAGHGLVVLGALVVGAMVLVV